MARQITINVSSGMCFQVSGDQNPNIQGQYQYANQEYQFMCIAIYKAITNVTITTTGNVAYWKC
jgi:hypothetical protein